MEERKQQNIFISYRRAGGQMALQQIKDKQYDEAMRHYRGDLLFVGINYDEKTKKHVCKIEKIVL